MKIQRLLERPKPQYLSISRLLEVSKPVPLLIQQAVELTKPLPLSIGRLPASSKPVAILLRRLQDLTKPIPLSIPHLLASSKPCVVFIDWHISNSQFCRSCSFRRSPHHCVRASHAFLQHRSQSGVCTLRATRSQDGTVLYNECELEV